jgi:hypothetical protein
VVIVRFNRPQASVSGAIATKLLLCYSVAVNSVSQSEAELDSSERLR